MTSNFSQDWMFVCIFLERVFITIIKKTHDSSLRKEQLAFIECLLCACSSWFPSINPFDPHNHPTRKIL